MTIEPNILPVDRQPQRQSEGEVSFSGSGWKMARLLIPGYLLMIPTLGLFRFWQVTQKRQFYWSRTTIDGDNLEYTGNATQLLLGFMLAILLFIPIAGIYLWLSTQDQDIIIGGYAIIAVGLYFLAGYAEYRARRFRFTRTLWRGLRFAQTGNAWSFAVRRFLWSILVVVTGGLAYPFMRTNLFKYAWNNTYFGDRQFEFTGDWRAVAAPFFKVYFFIILVAVLIGFLSFGRLQSGNMTAASATPLIGLLVFLMAFFAYYYLRARIPSRLYSALKIGETSIFVRVKARSLFWHSVLYVIWLIIFAIGLAVLSVMFVAFFQQDISNFEAVEFSQFMQLGAWQIALAIVGYLAILAIFALLAETLLALGYWEAVVRHARLKNVGDLNSVRGGDGDESPIAGEGLADALNVGAY